MHYSTPPFVFKVPTFQAGKLEAIGYINQKEVAKNAVSSAKEAAKIELSYDVSGKPLEQGTDDVVFVYAKIVDEYGNLVSNANNNKQFNVKNENVEIIGQNPVEAEAGIATVLIKVSSKAQAFSIEATCQSLTSANIDLLE